MRVVGDFTSALAEALGADPKAKAGKPTEMKDGETQKSGAFVVDPPLNRVLPRVMVDGPFGSASEDFYKYVRSHDIR